MNTARLDPVRPPYNERLQYSLDQIMPEGVEPLLFIRTVARHPQLFEKMKSLGEILLKKGQLSERDPEIVLHRTCGLD